MHTIKRHWIILDMKLYDFFYTKFTFNEDEELLGFKFRMLNVILLIVAYFAAFFGALHDLGLNDIGPIHSKVNYIYSFCLVLVLFFLHRSKDNYIISVHLLLILSLLAFTSDLIFVPQDEFRMMWFYLLAFVAFILGDSRNGIIYTALSILIILVCNYFVDLQLSQIAINSSVFGLLIGASLARVYTNKVSDYGKILQERNKTLKHFATVDGLTGIINRRYFDVLSKKYFETAQRNGSKVSLIIIDLDHFKDINDIYGHPAGDKILSAFAEKIDPITRKGDMFARIGGEEFAILMFDTDCKDASIFAEKICQITKDIFVYCEDKKLSVTISLGVSQNRESDTEFDEIYERADKALYQAKNDGRDRVCAIY